MSEIEQSARDMAHSMVYQDVGRKLIEARQSKGLLKLAAMYILFKLS